MRIRRWLLLGLLLVALGCDKPEDEAPAAAPGPSDRFGPLMMQIGHRLELSGRAARAGRWELAAYEVQELTEVYEGPLLLAPAPDEVHARIEPFITQCLEPLEAAAQSHDMARFEHEWAVTTTGCNACHQQAGVPFIEIPFELGVEVPRMSPVELDAGLPAPDPAPAPDPSPDPAP